MTEKQFKVGDKVRILDVTGIWLAKEQGYKSGDIAEVIRVNSQGRPLIPAKGGGRLIIGRDELQYIEKVAKFNIGDKVRIISTKGQPLLGFEDGDVVTITDANKNGSGVQRYEVRRSDGAIGFGGNNTFELVADKPQKPSKKQRLTDAEKRIAALEAEVATLKAAQSKPAIAIDLSPNARRAAIIAEAKAFVEDAKNFTGNISGRKGYKYASTNHIVCDVEFNVNAEKRTVVALLKYQYGGHVAAKGIAKCAPDDVFNADIGKAIALGRALGLDVSKFEQAVKPTVAVGQTFKVTQQGRITGTETVIKGLCPTFDGREGTAFRHSKGSGWLGSKQGVILDDTEAQY